MDAVMLIYINRLNSRKLLRSALFYEVNYIYFFLSWCLVGGDSILQQSKIFTDFQHLKLLLVFSQLSLVGNAERAHA